MPRKKKRVSRPSSVTPVLATRLALFERALASCVEENARQQTEIDALEKKLADVAGNIDIAKAALAEFARQKVVRIRDAELADDRAAFGVV